MVVGCGEFLGHTPRKFNIAPQNRPSQKGKDSLPSIHFSGAFVSFREGIRKIRKLKIDQIISPMLSWWFLGVLGIGERRDLERT